MKKSSVLSATEVVKKYFIFSSAAQALKTLVLDTTPPETVTALNHISLDLPKGEIIGVIGHNGAGKSTLLRVLSGVYKPSGGSITYVGSRSGLFEMGGIGTNSLTGLEFAERTLTLQGLPKKRLKSALRDIKDFSELEENFYKKILTYSSGMKSRLYFSVSTAIEYDIYLIDETLTVGDEHFQAKCWKRLKKRLNNGASGLLVTHDWSAVLQLCDYCIWFENGQIKKQGSTQNIIQEYINQSPTEFKIGAKFAKLPQSIKIQGQEPISVEIEIERTIKDLYFGYSLERMEEKFGWRIIALQNNLFIEDPSVPAKYQFTLYNPGLSPGNYYLNFFLTSKVTPGGNWHIYDVYSWTTNKGIPLTISGATSEFLVETQGQCI